MKQKLSQLAHEIRNADLFAVIMTIIVILWVLSAFVGSETSDGCSEWYSGYDTGWVDVCMDNYQE